MVSFYVEALKNSFSLKPHNFHGNIMKYEAEENYEHKFRLIFMRANIFFSIILCNLIFEAGLVVGYGFGYPSKSI